MDFTWLIIGILAVWRVTHLLHAEDGPWDLVVRLRRAAGAGMLGRMLDCFLCLSLWTAAPVAFMLGNGWRQRILLWLALSGGASLIERASGREPASQPAVYYEEEELDHVLLRETEEPASDDAAQPRLR